MSSTIDDFFGAEDRRIELSRKQYYGSLTETESAELAQLRADNERDQQIAAQVQAENTARAGTLRFMEEDDEMNDGTGGDRFVEIPNAPDWTMDA